MPPLTEGSCVVYDNLARGAGGAVGHREQVRSFDRTGGDLGMSCQEVNKNDVLHRISPIMMANR
jgi:hypothetical protein